MKQKFRQGDRVSIAKKLPSNMSHFVGGKNATVEYSYAERYGRGDKEKNHQYSLNIDGIGGTAWYPEELLTLLFIHPEKEISDWIKEYVKTRGSSLDQLPLSVYAIEWIKNQ
jgi:hypothetical protein